ncbi:hypothetical protein WEI85_03945 [Actinomycetes bacterium KLBMP 9797]
MTTPLEQELTRTLTAAVGAGPRPDEEFVGRVHRRQRQRRRRTVLVAACTAVLVMIGGGAAVGTLMSGSGDAEFAERIPDLDHLKSMEEVWPDAIRRIPGKLPGGGGYMVGAILDDNRYLVARTDESGGVSNWLGPFVFDVAQGTVRQLADTKLYGAMTPGIASGFLPAVAGDQAVWLVNGVRDGQRIVWEWWAAPLDGSAPARRLTSIETSSITMAQHVVTDDAIYWEDFQGREPVLHRLPLSGGEPEVVPGSQGYGLGPRWPWLTPKTNGFEEQRGGTLWNLVTGERLSWTANPKTKHVSCDRVACYGQSAGGVGVIQRLDGTGYREVPGTTALQADGLRIGGNGRFVTGGMGSPSSERPPGLRPVPDGPTTEGFLWDRETDMVANISGLPGGVSRLAENGDMIVFDRQALLD